MLQVIIQHLTKQKKVIIKRKRELQHGNKVSELACKREYVWQFLDATKPLSARPICRSVGLSLSIRPASFFLFHSFIHSFLLNICLLVITSMDRRTMVGWIEPSNLRILFKGTRESGDRYPKIMNCFRLERT